jgi:uncharacterized protein involved in exopolysaccharide biosynthesis
MSEQHDEILRDLSLLAVWKFLCRNVAIVSICVVVVTAGAVVVAFSMTPKYRAEVVISPAESPTGLGQLGGQLGDLASLAGINIGGNAGRKSDEALAYLRSRVFTAGFINRHGLMPALFAKKWDAHRGQWRDTNAAPTISEAVKKFSTQIREVIEDRRTGIITVAIVWTDPKVAAEWANSLIADADAELRARTVAEQTRSVDYLEREAALTTDLDVRATVYKVMESELKNAMLARTRDAYAFKVIDPAVVRDPHDRESPNRPLIALMGIFLGIIVGVIVAALLERRSALRHH